MFKTAAKPQQSGKKPATVKVAMWSARHRWPVIGLWFLFTIGLFVVSISLGGTKTADDTAGNGAFEKTEAFKANQVYNAGVKNTDPSQDMYLVVSHPTLKANDPTFKETVGKIVGKLQGATYTENGQAQPVFSQVINPYSVPPQFGLVSPDNSAVRIVATTKGDDKTVETKQKPVKGLITDFKTQNSEYKIYTLNYNWLNDDINDVVNKDLDGSMKITLPLTFLILLVAFGAVAAAVVPLILAITALLAAFGFLGIYSHLVDPVSSYANQLIVLIGLAVAVDYSLFMITRYRAERRRGRDKMHAIEVASSTAGRAVFFSGMTVAISVAGLFLLDDPTFRSMALGTIVVVMLSILGSLTFLPAVLSILGNGVNWGRLPYFGRDREEGSGFWSKLVQGVMRRPAILMLMTVALLLALASPVLHLKLGTVDIDSFPSKIDGVQAINFMNEKWPNGTTLKMYVMVTNADRPEVMAAIKKFQQDALQVKGLSQPSDIQMSPNGNVARVSFTMAGGRNDEANLSLVKQTRSELVPAHFNAVNTQAYVAGSAASNLDVTKIYTDAMPLVFAFVLGLSFLLLLVAFHSLVIPVKAIILNLLSTAASYGVMVLVFQDGWFGQQLDIKATGVIQNWVPVFIFTILFGLSMDYHLFILTRIKEAKDKGATSNEAVAQGISITSGTITSAASIMVVVFAVFVTLQLVIIRQMGLGLAVAVFVDATIIRCVLLPATMRLLGDWNWYMPKFLDWIPQVTIEGEPEAESQLPEGETEEETVAA